jgi:hypothetical protein
MQEPSTDFPYQNKGSFLTEATAEVTFVRHMQFEAVVLFLILEAKHSLHETIENPLVVKLIREILETIEQSLLRSQV